MVLLDHASDANLRIFPAADMNRAGKYGVYLFFVLSAFLLTHLLLVRPAAELRTARTWLNYFMRRFLRIFPLYAAVLLSMVWLHHLKIAQVVPHLLLRDGVRQFWTIPVEVKYYLLLPFVVLTISGLCRKEWWRGILFGVVLIGLSWALFRFERVWSWSDTIYLSRNLEPFIFGSVAALVHAAFTRHALMVSRFAWWLEIAAAGVFVYSFVRIPFIYNQVFHPSRPVHKFSDDSFVCAILWTVLLLGILHGKGFMRRVMECLPLRYLGLVSYSAYLWHLKFLRDVDDMPLPPPVRLLVFLIVVVAVSSVSYFLIERPLSKIKLRGNRGQARMALR